ncbi:hypothetical protein ONS95_004058 [Cadophora gregata]|uniref:uncharacterized protein n=1 Tax=Cadophora gregata TaxID=51156 RepID=UPI0026DC566A|nr:uncharacterized protein ONS95_004058 [Cadophora gregata]KAK0107365.1 hypothetical protein ONS95_004058 [Cadophora gregata]KAK0117043.1 hypothetical protein ONS96_012885 [Cadophora gregata f. sp. sojae]
MGQMLSDVQKLSGRLDRGDQKLQKIISGGQLYTNSEKRYLKELKALRGAATADNKVTLESEKVGQAKLALENKARADFRYERRKIGATKSADIEMQDAPEDSERKRRRELLKAASNLPWLEEYEEGL